MRITARNSLATILALGIIAGGCSKKPTPLDQSPVSAQLKHFIAEKKAQATAAAVADKQEMLPEFQTIFAAAENGNWQRVSNTFEDLERFSKQYRKRNASIAPSGSWITQFLANLRRRILDKGDEARMRRLHGTQWEDLREVDGMFECLASNPNKDKYFVALGQDIVRSIPPGSIYFGGSDPGRWTITALQTSQVNGDPFFTLTQNAMADPTYLEYLRGMYGKRIYIPTPSDSQKCFQDYMGDVQRRIVHDQTSPNEPKQIKPGEDVKVDSSGHVQVSGQVAVMAINGELVKVIFDHETNREFYVEESFPLDWMYPHLEPHGLIMKIHHAPLAELPDEVIRRDHGFWTKEVLPVIGDWLKDDTSVREICAFVEKIHLERDLKGFKGDSEIVNGGDDWTGWLSKLRYSIAGIYAWRAGISPSGGIVPEEFSANGAARDRMIKEADFAYRQAFALCPRSPEAVWRYVNFLVALKRNADALAVAETGLDLSKGKPDADNFQKLVDAIKSHSGPGATFSLPPQPSDH